MCVVELIIFLKTLVEEGLTEAVAVEFEEFVELIAFENNLLADEDVNGEKKRLIFFP